MKHIRYFRSQIFEPAEELSRAEAERRGTYLRCYYPEERGLAHPDYAEVIKHTETGIKIQRVIYYDRPLPHTEVLRQHLKTYPNLRVEITLPQDEDSETVYVRYRYNQKGELRHTEEGHKSTDLFAEIRKDPDGNVIGIIEYVYDENHELMLTRERNADGTIISEDVWL